jgi:hypothetical protein
MKKKWVGCSKCNRVLWEEDADKDGLCVDCRPAPKKKKPIFFGSTVPSLEVDERGNPLPPEEVD